MKNIFLASALLIAGLLIGFNWVSNAQTPQQPTPPVRYDYLMVSTYEYGTKKDAITIINIDGTKKEIPLTGEAKLYSEQISNALQEIGSQGWELVDVSGLGGFQQLQRSHFKRIKR